MNDPANLIVTGIFTIAAMSLNLLLGYTGQLSLGHVAFFGIGAYVSSLVSLGFSVHLAPDWLVTLDPQRVHGLHMVQSVLALPEHLDIFENGVAARLDLSFSGPQGARLAKLVSGGRIEIGAIHTYLELFSRYFVDLTPKVALVAAQAADAQGNLYTGPNTEDTPPTGSTSW